ncbi:MAG: cytochrome c [Paraburkholderia sp.]|nr:MAG: cytochrome c [Paraburkholderia sp.]
MDSKTLIGAVCLTVVVMAPVAVARAQRASGDEAERGRIIVQAECAACHGADGNSASPQFPKLAGQKVAYLDAQLEAFQAGERPSAVMTKVVASVSDADLAAAARYFSEQTVRAG